MRFDPSRWRLTLVLFTLTAASAQTVQVSVGSTFRTTVIVDGNTLAGFPFNTFSWVVGSTHTLATTDNQIPSPGDRFLFSGWSDGGAISHQITVPASNTVYVANFNEGYGLSVNSALGGTTNWMGSNNFFNIGTMVNLTATPFYAFSFGGWTGSGSGSYTGPNANTTVTMNAPLTETPNFVLTGLLGQNATNFVFTDPLGQAWLPGPFGVGYYATSARIAGTNEPFLYQSEGFSTAPTPFSTQILLPNGSYNLRLKFAEIYFTHAGQRQFNVSINGSPALTNFDVAAEAGASNTAVDRVFPVTVTNQVLNVAYTPVVSNPKLSAFAITPAQVDLTVAPTIAVLTAGQTKQFTARAIGNANTNVNWTLNPPGVGTVDSTGLYTAPGAVNARQTVTITATSQADSSKSASSIIKLGFPYQSQDIGAVNAAGGFSSQTEAYTVTGAGDLNGTADAFRFAWQPLTGDGSITARMNTVFNGLPTKGGVMIRESATPGSSHALISMFAGIVGLMESRTSTGGSTAVQFGAAGVNWVRLTRQGNIFTGYVSNDGIAWQLVSSANIAMASQAQVGLAVSSGFGAPYSVVFDNIDISGTTTVAIDQTLASLGLSQQAQFTATVSGNANTVVTWSISPAGLGSISASGLYTAPASLPIGPQSVTINAVSVADPTKSASVVAQIGAFQLIRVNAGGPTHIDPNGLFWQGDTGSTAGFSYSAGASIPNTTTPYLYLSERFNTSDLIYSYFVPNATYNVTLKFAEIFFSSAGQRVFNILINGTPVASNFDIVAQAGGALRAVDRTFPVTVTNGQITILLQKVTSSPKISAIQIAP
jgi:regulation of enolase protein 1 (concanavalin A-like superfamily)